MSDINENAYVSTHSERSIHDPDGANAQAELELAALVFQKLWAHYPRRDWRVKVSIDQGICFVQLPRLHHSTLGFNFGLELLAADPTMKIVVRAGGEILEHLGLTRGRFNKAEYTDAIRNRPVAMTRYDWHGALADDKHQTTSRPRLIVPDRLRYYQPDQKAVNDNGGSVEAAILAYAREIGLAA